LEIIMPAVVTLIPIVLQLVEQGVTLAPELIAQLKTMFAGVTSDVPLTPEEEAVKHALLVQLNAEVQAS
jgi:hypothetical protein